MRIADPDAGRELGHVTAEPRVLEVLGGSGLARHGPASEGRRPARTVLDDSLEGVRELGRDVRPEDARARYAMRDPADQLPVRPADAFECLRIVWWMPPEAKVA